MGFFAKIRFERGLQSASPGFLEIWMLIPGFTLWYGWKALCLKVFQDLVRPLEEVIMGHIVCAYQLPTRAIGRGLPEVCNHSKDMVTVRLRFWQKWRNTPMVTQGGSGSRWNYQPPRWLFQTHLPPSLHCRPQELSRTSQN